MRYIQKIIKSLSAGKDKNQQGFTIVEVMIVLAIAGLILAVVFVAVPALQRNQRNNARRNDVAYIKAQLNQLVANAGNRVPTSPSQIGGILKVGELNYLGKNGMEADDLKTATTEIITQGTVYYSTDGSVGHAAGAETGIGTTDTDIVVLLANKSCDKDIIGDTTANTNNGVNLKGYTFGTASASRNIAVIYTLEGDTNTYCEDTTL